MNTQELYIKTIFCCMACDGDIANEEVALVHNITSKQNIFDGMDVNAIINGYVASINDNGPLFFKQYLNELSSQELSNNEQKTIVDFALKTIFADNRIEYSEVKFFKKIRSRLSLTDEEILDNHPDVEDFLLPDINVAEDPVWENVVFEIINFADYEQI